MNIYSFFRTVGFFLHYLISKSAIITKLYISILSLILRSLPSFNFKYRIVNSIDSVKWPHIDLAPQTVRVGSDTDVKIIPHFSEFDFEAVVSRKLNYETDVFSYLESCIGEYDAIIEIGANVGIYSIFFSAIFAKIGKASNSIFVFEPSREAYFRLLQNLANNHCQNVQAFNCALGKDIDVLNFFEPEGHLTNGSFYADFAENFSQSVRVSQVIVVNGNLIEKLVEKYDRILLKVDVEGAEYSVLQGLQKFIERKTPDIIIEVLPAFQDELNQLDYLFTRKYNFFNFTDRGLVSQENFVAHPIFRDYLLKSPGFP